MGKIRRKKFELAVIMLVLCVVLAGCGSKGDATADSATEELQSIETAKDLEKGTYANVTISEELGDGDVTLTDVTIAGDLIVKGGGSNSVKLVRCSIGGKIIMDKKGGEAPRLYLKKTQVDQIEIKEPAILEADKNSEIKNVETVAALTIQGRETTVINVNVPKEIENAVELLVTGGTVVNVKAESNVVIEGEKDAKIENVEAKFDVEVKGENTIVKNIVVPKEAASTVTITVTDAKVENVEAKGETVVEGTGKAAVEKVQASASVRVASEIVKKVEVTEDAQENVTVAVAGDEKIEVEVNTDTSKVSVIGKSENINVSSKLDEVPKVNVTETASAETSKPSSEEKRPTTSNSNTTQNSQEPSKEPEKPADKPQEPSKEPEKPADKPQEPSKEPDKPVEEPEEPSEEIFELELNGKKTEIHSQPVLIGDEMYISMTDGLGLFGYESFWLEDYEQVVALRNGKIAKFYIGNKEYEMAGNQRSQKSMSIAPILKDGKALIALSSLDEIMGSTSKWTKEPVSIKITGTVPKLIDYYLADSFGELGTWQRQGTFLMGTTKENPDTVVDIKTEPAVLEVLIKEAGEYKLWVNARDFSNNQPGTRYFNVTVDGKQSAVTFGQHNQDGFHWTDGGVFKLEEGIHTIQLLDTSNFYARCSGIILSQDMNFVPTTDEEMASTVEPYNPFAALITPEFPQWAKDDINAKDSVTITSDAAKVTFYKGISDKNGKEIVQNEIYIKDGNEWKCVKTKTEELGFLMLDATASEYVTTEDEVVANLQTFNLGGKKVSMITKDFFKSGNSTWFIPSGMEKVNNDTVKLTFENNDKVSLSVNYSLADNAEEPKVTINAKFLKDGAYSFLLYSGDAVEYEAFDRVTAPLLYVKKDFPELGSVTAECFMFTPMSTFTYPSGKVVEGKKLTSGIVVDPDEITMEDNYSYPDTSKFGFTFQTADGKYRNQLVAPMFGTEHSRFKAGESVSISYRIVNRCEDWFDTFQYVTEEIYSLADVRTNYHSSINDAIYNATELMMDDEYGGWDDNAMGFYNMENPDLVTQANVMEIVQRYLLTEDEELLEERVIPTLAYSLSRPSFHSLPTNQSGGGYVPEGGPTSVGSPIAQFGTNVFGGLYEMTQGRIPYLMNYAVNNVTVESSLSGINSMIAMYKYTGNDLYKNKLMELADNYLKNNPIDRMNVSFEDGFVYGDYINTVVAFTNTYEVTNEQRYLNAAKECAEILMTGLWTTGYQSDRLTETYTIDPDSTMERLLNCDAVNADFWYHGSTKWRLGNQVGEAKKPQDLDLKIEEETVPAWLLSKAGMGTEHTKTPGHGNVITMNNWVGTLQRLAEYTGEDYFEMQARNATLGRYSNYPGYYQDRNIVHQMEEDYPYTGPDYTSVYWHHIPSFIAMLEDYLINSVWVKSGQGIEFPSVNQNGYAYFASSQYGQEAGNFYDQEGMWLWLDEGVVETNNVNLDYIAARKDGVLGLAFVNEANTAVTQTIRLGQKVSGGQNFNGTATVYDAQGNKTSVSVANGSFELTIPSKGIVSVVLNIDGVTAPAYAREYTYSTELGDTYQEHENAKAHVLQMTGNEYFAYLYTTLKADEISSLKVEYSYGDGETPQVVEDHVYPFEAIVKVTDSDAEFTYTMTATKVDGSTMELGTGTLKALDSTEGGVDVPDDVEDSCQLAEDFSEVEPFVVNVVYSGSRGWDIRLATNQADYPQLIREHFGANALSGMKACALFRNNTTGEIKILESEVRSNIVRTENGIKRAIVVLDPSADVPAADYSNYTIQLAMCGSKVEANLRDYLDLSEQIYRFQLKLLSQETVGEFVQFEVTKKDFLKDVTVETLTGMPISIDVATGAEEAVTTIETTISGCEIKTNSIIIKVDKNCLAANQQVVRLGLKPVLTPTVLRTGTSGSDKLRIVTDMSSYTLKPSAGQINGFNLYAKFINKSTKEVLRLETTINRNEISAYASDQMVLEVTVPSSELMKYDQFNQQNYDMYLAVGETNTLEELKAIVEEQLADPGTIKLKLIRQGSDSEGFRFVVSKENIAKYAAAGKMNGMKLKAEFVPKNGGTTLVLEGTIKRNGDADNGVNTTIVIPGTAEVPATGNYSNYDIKLTLFEGEEEATFDNSMVEGFKMDVIRSGSAPNIIKLVVARSQFPEEIQNRFDTDTLKGMKILAVLHNEESGATKVLNTEVQGNTLSKESNGVESVVISCIATSEVPAADYSSYKIEAAIKGANAVTDLSTLLDTNPFSNKNVDAFTFDVIRSGSDTGVVKLVAKQSQFPDVIKERFAKDILKGMKILAVLHNEATGDTKILDTVVQGNTLSTESDGEASVVISCAETSTVPAATYGDYTIKVAMKGANVVTDLSTLVDTNPFSNKNVTGFHVNVAGKGEASGNIRLVVNKSEFEDSIKNRLSENVLIGMDLFAVMCHKDTGVMKFWNTTVDGVELRDTSIVIICKGPSDITWGEYPNYTISEAALKGVNATTDLSSLVDTTPGITELTLVRQGSNQEGFRFVVSKEGLGDYATAGSMNGKKLRAEFTPKAGGESLILVGTILRNEEADAGVNTTVVVPGTSTVPVGAYGATHDIKLTLFLK